jgi:hypothetical protein
MVFKDEELRPFSNASCPLQIRDLTNNGMGSTGGFLPGAGVSRQLNQQETLSGMI